MAVPTLAPYVLFRGRVLYSNSRTEIGRSRGFGVRVNLLGKLPIHATDDPPIAEKKRGGGVEHVMQIRFSVVLGP